MPEVLRCQRMKQNSLHFFVAITALSLFIQCLFFLEGEKKRERESDGDKKMHGVLFHHVKVLHGAESVKRNLDTSQSMYFLN